MRQIRLLTFYLFYISQSLHATPDSIPNHSFELWGDTTTPTYWSTWSSTITNYNFTHLSHRDTTPGYSTDGVASLRLFTDSVTLPGASYIGGLFGFACLGTSTYTIGTGLTFGRYPFHSRPDTLSFDYLYNPIGSDTALISVFLSQWDTVTRVRHSIYAHTITLLATSGWSHIAFPILPYTLPLTPDSIQLIIRSGAVSTQRGSTLWMDHLYFNTDIYIVAGLPVEAAPSLLMAYPNPAAHSLHILSPADMKDAYIRLYSLDGNLLIEQHIQGRLSTIDVSHLPTATYLLDISSLHGLVHSKGKIIISH